MTDQQPQSLVELTKLLHLYNLQMQQVREEFDKQQKELKSKIQEVQTQIKMLNSGLDLGKIRSAEAIIYVAGKYLNGGTARNTVINDVIAWFCELEPVNYPNLWQRYAATKDYDRWSGQRQDCEYGFVPKHGRIVFEIGIHRDLRQAWPADTKPSHAFAPSDIEAVVYYLNNIERIELTKEAGDVK